jgi:coatomer subunit beta
LLSNPKQLASLSSIEKLLAVQGKQIFSKFLEKHSRLIQSAKSSKEKSELLITQPDELVVYRQLKQGGKGGVTDFDITEEITTDGDFASGSDFMTEIKKDMEAKVFQLTGYSDPLYAEAFVEVHHYDIILKILLINRTNKTLPNINCELLTQGNLKLVEKPLSSTLRAFSSITVKASLKVSSTDNGAIYGYLTYDSASGNIPNIMNLNEI